MIEAERAGATVRWAEFDSTTGEFDPSAVAAVVTDRTRLVAVTGASNLIGTRPDLPAIAEVVHQAGALLWVDGVHATAHVLTDVENSGADFWVCSPYKFLGPHLGVLAATPTLLEALHPDKLLPSSDAVPERFELGTLPYELLAGTTAAVDFLADLTASDANITPREGRRAALVASFAALEQHEDALLERLDSELRDLPGVTVHSNAKRRTPTLLFTADGHDPQAIRGALARVGVNAPAGHFYAWECSHHLGLGGHGRGARRSRPVHERRRHRPSRRRSSLDSRRVTYRPSRVATFVLCGWHRRGLRGARRAAHRAVDTSGAEQVSTAQRYPGPVARFRSQAVGFVGRGSVGGGL